MAKERASMNRTITLDDSEINDLKLQIQDYYHAPNEIICGDFNIVNASIPT